MATQFAPPSLLLNTPSLALLPQQVSRVRSLAARYNVSGLRGSTSRARTNSGSRVGFELLGKPDDPTASQLWPPSMLLNTEIVGKLTVAYNVFEFWGSIARTAPDSFAFADSQLSPVSELFHTPFDPVRYSVPSVPASKTIFVRNPAGLSTGFQSTPPLVLLNKLWSAAA